MNVTISQSLSFRLPTAVPREVQLVAFEPDRQPDSSESFGSKRTRRRKKTDAVKVPEDTFALLLKSELQNCAKH